jgi:hypothetical protein
MSALAEMALLAFAGSASSVTHQNLKKLKSGPIKLNRRLTRNSLYLAIPLEMSDRAGVDKILLPIIAQIIKRLGLPAQDFASNTTGLSSFQAFVGNIGSFSNCHLDRDNAINVALQLLDVGEVLDEAKILAIWYSWPAELFLQWTLNPQTTAKMRQDVMEALNLSDFTTDVVTQLRSIPGFPTIHETEQRHGDVILVSPGVTHGVINMSPNIKIAHDVFDSSNGLLYAKSNSLMFHMNAGEGGLLQDVNFKGAECLQDYAQIASRAMHMIMSDFSEL